MKVQSAFIRAFAVTSLSFLPSPFASANDPALKITLEDGSSTVYPLTKGVSMKFEGEEIVISDIDLDVKIPLDNLKKWEYVLPSSGASDPISSETRIDLDGTILRITGIRTGEAIHIYSVDGKLMFAGVSAGSKTEIATDSWPAGVYIINHSGNSAKIIKK